MFPHFANETALWALLGVPFLIAVHCLRRRRQERLCATLFLLESLAPENREGRVWRKLRSSRALWMQILAVLLLTWVLADPCRPRGESRQIVAFVLDETADMKPFRQETLRAVEDDMNRLRRRGIPVTWTLMGSRKTALPFYRGSDMRAALQSLDAWNPACAAHDPAAALRAASAMAGNEGIVRFVTCAPDRVPTGQCARGVGRPLDNAGFSGLSPAGTPGEARWRIGVKNNSPRTARLPVAIECGFPNATTRREDGPCVEVAPHGLAEFVVALPPGCDRATLRLPPDAFPDDDALPLVRPVAKPVAVRLDAPESALPVFRRLCESLPGLHEESTDSNPAATVSIARCRGRSANDIPSPAIVLAENGRPSSGLVSAEKHPLTDGLNWSGLLVPEVGSMVPGKRATLLLWQKQTPLAWLENGSLVMNWVWEKSNADRVAAPLLMARRFLESVQNQSSGTVIDNLPGGALAPWAGGVTIRQTLPGGERREVPYDGRLPLEACFAEIPTETRGGPPLFSGAIWFADAALGDFSRCAAFDTPFPEPQAAARRFTRSDPLAPLWLCLAAAALLLAWLPPSPSRR